MKIANDVRWLASGPGAAWDPYPGERARLLHHARQGQPTQCEAVTMVAVQVMANDVAVGLAASQGTRRAERVHAGASQLPVRAAAHRLHPLL